MAGILGDGSACTIRGLIWALGRTSFVKERPEAFKSKNKQCFLELKLVDAYEQFEKILCFIDSFEKVKVDCPVLNENPLPRKNGIYLRLFIKGIREVVQSFSYDLIELEKSLLLDPTGVSIDSLATAQQMHDTYLLINNLIQQICDGNLEGCQVLDVCHKCLLSSQDTSVGRISMLVNCLHKQMLKQIKSWSLYGELDDPFCEFFIKRTPAGMNPASLSLSIHQSCVNTSISTELNASLIESTSASLPFSKMNQERLTNDIDNCYEIDPAFLPSHIPYSLASKIFSLGKFMIQIKHNPSNKIPVSIMAMNTSDFGIDESHVRSLFKEVNDGITFHHHTLENVIDIIWCQINKYMKRIAEEEGDLSTHHRNITDVYLMGRGGLSRYFLDKASHLLLNDAVKVFSRSLDLTLERVAQDLYGTDNLAFLKRFHFSLPPKGETPSGQSVLSVMKLVYKSPWPLPLIYSKDVLETYNSVFVFLLNMKRAHRSLTITWNEMTAISDEVLKRSANDLYFHLMSLITNLQSYVFVDVILSETDGFWAIIKESDSFDEILMAHSKFLSNIVMRLFLLTDKQFNDKAFVGCQNTNSEFRNNVGLVHKEITSLFSLTHKFLMTVELIVMDPADGQRNLNDLNHKFNLLVLSLISLVKKMNEKFYSEYLCALLMRLDYNDYYLHLYNI